MCTPWKEALLVCLLGKKLGYRLMKSKLSNVWRLKGGFDLLDADNGFYMVKFDMKEDREMVINGGPWMIFDHYLAVSTWSSEFISPAAKVAKTLAWIRIPGLNVVFYDESYLLSIARAIGRPVKVDMNTLNAERGRFARICVELDLSLPVVGKVCLEGYWYKIEYEGLHVICTKYGCYGHRSRECSAQAIAVAPQLEKHGDGISNKDTAENATVTVPEVASQHVESGASGKGGPQHDTPMDSGENIPTMNAEVTPPAPVTTRQDHVIDANFEVLGEWMTVVKKKKKQIPKNMEREAGPSRREPKGVTIEQSNRNHGAKKESLKEKVASNKMGPKGVFNFSVGSSNPNDKKVDENKKKRSRVVGPERSSQQTLIFPPATNPRGGPNQVQILRRANDEAAMPMIADGEAHPQSIGVIKNKN
ncbi:uncharacterized protein LOC130736701 [Lotus japonicus]|uniref:uncharacterized protein LOC130736701 n=1 Tax=Lotus japonicus TaxID=34305 RepID=UPI00258E743F|nr:uncharacterized protein LOC130736701 [Lotus japonicus]